MFDLNEIPEHPSDHFVAAEDLRTAPFTLDAGVKESKLSGHGLLPFVQKDLDEAPTVTLEKPVELLAFRSPVASKSPVASRSSVASKSSAELLPSGSSLSSSLTFEVPQAPKRQNGNDSKAALVLEEDDVENGDEVGLASNLLQIKQQHKQPQQQEILPETDLFMGSHSSEYQFISGEASTSHTHRVSADASTSRTHEDSLDNCEDEHKTSSLFPLQKTIEPQIRLRNGHGQEEGQVSSPSTDGSAIRLSLGGSSLNLHANEMTRCSSGSLKRADVFGLALGRSDDRPLLSSRKSSDLSPFWRGKLRTDAPLLTPVDAYCLGIMKPDSRLKKLPAILSSQKFVKLEEFMKSLRNGVTEPLTQFKPSLEASLEEVNRFNLMVNIIKVFKGGDLFGTHTLHNSCTLQNR